MGTEQLTDLIKWLLIIIVSIIMAWEKLKKWYFKRSNKDRRAPNPHPGLATLCQAFKDHEKMDEKRTDEIKGAINTLREGQSRHSTAIAVLKSKMK